MKILSLDSTALTATAAICDQDHLLAQMTLNNGLTHSETLLPMVEALLSSAGLMMGDIDMFACSAGPGSFTGVRIGVATIKGLAFGRGKVCIGVSSLYALAYNLLSCDGIICPVMNARRQQVYNALFECRGGKLTRLCDDRAISISALEEELTERTDKVWLCGDGYKLVTESFREVRVCPTPNMLVWPSAYSVAQCARKMYESGVCTTDNELLPIYLRMPQAERERLNKEQGN